MYILCTKLRLFLSFFSKKNLRENMKIDQACLVGVALSVNKLKTDEIYLFSSNASASSLLYY